MASRYGDVILKKAPSKYGGKKSTDYTLPNGTMLVDKGKPTNYPPYERTSPEGGRDSDAFLKEDLHTGELKVNQERSRSAEGHGQDYLEVKEDADGFPTKIIARGEETGSTPKYRNVRGVAKNEPDTRAFIKSTSGPYSKATSYLAGDIPEQTGRQMAPPDHGDHVIIWDDTIDFGPRDRHVRANSNHLPGEFPIRYTGTGVHLDRAPQRRLPRYDENFALLHSSRRTSEPTYLQAIQYKHNSYSYVNRAYDDNLDDENNPENNLLYRRSYTSMNGRPMYRLPREDDVAKDGLPIYYTGNLVRQISEYNKTKELQQPSYYAPAASPEEPDDRLESPSDGISAGVSPISISAYAGPIWRQSEQDTEDTYIAETELHDQINNPTRNGTLTSINSAASIKELKEKFGENEKKIRPPAEIFILLGSLIIACGIARLLICYLHKTYESLWCGVLVLIMGITGVCHCGKYDSPLKNKWYIGQGFLTMVALWAAKFFTLWLFIPMFYVASTQSDIFPSVGGKEVRVEIKGFYSHFTIIKEIDIDLSRWLCVALDIFVLLCMTLSEHILFGLLLVADRHWYRHHSSPGVKKIHPTSYVLFNPFHLVHTGQATFVMGIVHYNVMNTLSIPTADHSTTGLWAGPLVMAAGLLSVAARTRSHKINLVLLSVFVVALASLASGAGIVIILLRLYEYCTDLHKTLPVLTLSTLLWAWKFVPAVVMSALILLLLINIIISMGVVISLARQVRAAPGSGPGKEVPNSVQHTSF